MKSKSISLVLTSVAFSGILVGLTHADQIRIRADRVVPVVVDQDLSLKDSRKGDRFTATVQDDRDLPSGTRFQGRIVDIEQKHDGKPGYLDLEFTGIELPDGTRARISSKPIAMDSAKKDRDGHFVAKPQVSKQAAVLGGAGAGLILGALIKKPFEGAFIGALAGIFVAETSAGDKYTNGDVAVKKGSKLGALILRNFTVDYDDRHDINRRDADRDGDFGKSGDRDGDIDRDRDGDRDRDSDRDRDGDSRDIRLTYREHVLNFDRDQKPYYEGETLMVPLNDIASQLDLEVDRTKDKVVYIEDDNGSLKIEQDSTAYRLNGKKGNLSTAVKERDGVLYVPIEILAAMKKEAIFLNGSRINIRA